MRIKRKIKLKRMRRRHTCEVCGSVIKRGEKAFAISVTLSPHQRRPEKYYYHYREGISEEEISQMTFSEIRNKICFHKEEDI